MAFFMLPLVLDVMILGRHRSKCELLHPLLLGQDRCSAVQGRDLRIHTLILSRSTYILILEYLLVPFSVTRCLIYFTLFFFQVTEEDACSQFLVSRSDVGKNVSASISFLLLTLMLLVANLANTKRCKNQEKLLKP